MSAQWQRSLSTSAVAEVVSAVAEEFVRICRANCESSSAQLQRPLRGSAVAEYGAAVADLRDTEIPFLLFCLSINTLNCF